MEAIKKAFGVVLLATAVWIVSPVIPVVAQMLAWSLLLIVPAIYLHALDSLPPHARGWQRFWKGIGIVLLLLAIWFGGKVGAHPTWGPAFTFTGTQITWMLIGYGFVAAVLPVLLLLTGRYLFQALMMAVWRRGPRLTRCFIIRTRARNTPVSSFSACWRTTAPPAR